MNIKDKYLAFKKRRAYKKGMRRLGNRNIRRSKLLYPVVVYGSVLGFVYGVSCVWTGFPIWPSFASIYLIIGLTLFSFIRKNWRMGWLFIRDIDQGRLLLIFNNTTQWSYEHKMKAVQWVYPRNKEIRKERMLELGEKVRNGKELDQNEKREMKYRVVTCPQQLLDGFNKATMINSLIWANMNINLLDDELRKILDLTDENMAKFNYQQEIKRAQGDENEREYDRLVRIGKRNSKVAQHA